MADTLALILIWRRLAKKGRWSGIKTMSLRIQYWGAYRPVGETLKFRMSDIMHVVLSDCGTPRASNYIHVTSEPAYSVYKEILAL